MASECSDRGVSRVVVKLEAAMTAGHYYEAHQMYRTLYFRYILQKKYGDCLELLYKGAQDFISREQLTSGADLVLLLIDVLEKSPKDIYVFSVWMQRLALLIKNLGPNVVERETIIARAVKWSADVSNTGSPQMHSFIAHVLWLEGNTEQARHHFLLSKDGFSCGQMLVQVSQSKGYASEVDLFIAQVVLQQLCLKETATALETFETYIKYHPKIATTEPPFILPLLNFLFFLLKITESGRLATFKSLCELYKPSIDRDPSYEKYLQKIGVIFFGASPPQQPGMGGLFGDIFNRLFQGMDEDEENPPSNAQNRNTVTSHTSSAELD